MVRETLTQELLEQGRCTALAYLHGIKPAEDLEGLKRQKAELRGELQGVCRDMADSAVENADVYWEGAVEVLDSWFDTHRPGNQKVCVEHLAWTSDCPVEYHAHLRSDAAFFAARAEGIELWLEFGPNGEPGILGRCPSCHTSLVFEPHLHPEQDLPAELAQLLLPNIA